MKNTLFSTDWILTWAPGVEGQKKINLPNDFIIGLDRKPDMEGGPSTGFFQGGTAKYIKYFTPEEAKKTILDIDGAYMHARVFFNGHQLATHHHGYTPFLVDLTPHLRPGRTNKIEIFTTTVHPSTRWYCGAGLYRDVFLWTGGEMRIEPRDIFVTTEKISKDSATICARIDVSSDLSAEASLIIEIAPKNNPANVIRTSRRLQLSPDQKTHIDAELIVPSPLLWSPDSPSLYTLKARVLPTNATTPELSDSTEITFGIRTIKAVSGRGLLLNGDPIKLRGGCLHHDHGVLGAVALPKADFRRLSRLKSAGFNAIRTSHYPPSREFLDLCDELGILVMDEAFDMWNIPKCYLDYNLWFNECCHKDCAAMVLRDRVHPSVISYSIGNEIPETAGHSDVSRIAAELKADILALDKTRLVTICTFHMTNEWRMEESDPDDYKEDFKKEFIDEDALGNDTSWPRRTDPFYDLMDICGYNYLYTRYEGDLKRKPNRIIWGSETHTINIFHSWNEVMRLPNVIGDFTWVAWDNLGEVGTGRSEWGRNGLIQGISLAEYPWRSCYQGDFNLIGTRRPQSYYRETVWSGTAPLKIFTTHPEHYGESFSGTRWHWDDVLDTWTFPPRYLNCPVLCEVYTRADEVVWFLNGEKVASSKVVEYKAKATIPYTPGSLEAFAYKNGIEIARSSLNTTNAPARIILKPEDTSFKADGRDLCFIEIEITDSLENRIADSKAPLHAHVFGGEFLGIFSGDPKNEDLYTSKDCHAFEGRALLILRATKPESITVTVCSEELAGCSTTIEAVL